MAAFGIGETLRRERERQGISLDDIARTTKIQPRFLTAIEADDFDSLPGRVFARNFVRQYSQALQLDAEKLLAGLPKPDESTIRLPDPPARPRQRSSYTPPRSAYSSWLWFTLTVAAGIVLYTHFNTGTKIRAVYNNRVAARSVPAQTTNAPQSPREPDIPEVAGKPPASSPHSAPPVAASSVQVVVLANQPAWVELSADGKTSFMGTLMPNEKKEISALEQVKIIAGNAGGLTVSLNGKPLEPLGSVGQVRVVKLTAEGPQFLPESPPPATDPL